MTKTELMNLTVELSLRFDSLKRKFEADENRPRGDSTPSLLVAWWDVFRDVEYPAALSVVRDIFAGKIKRPFDSDLPALIAAEVRARNRERNNGSRDWLADIESAKSEADEAKEIDAMREIEYGPAFDNLSSDEQCRLAAEILDAYMLGRWRKNPNSYLARQMVLEGIADRHRQQRTRPAYLPFQPAAATEGALLNV